MVEKIINNLEIRSIKNNIEFFIVNPPFNFIHDSISFKIVILGFRTAEKSIKKSTNSCCSTRISAFLV